MAKLYINGSIGGSVFDENRTSAAQVQSALGDIPADEHIDLHINSEGGGVGEGLAIYNAFIERGNITTHIDGYALSIASVIALAGDRVISPRSSIWMIHEAWTTGSGNADQLRKDADLLDKHTSVIAGIYAAELGKSEAEMRGLMKAETWMTGAEAVAFGFADAMTEEPVALAALTEASAKRCPQNILNLINSSAINSMRQTAELEDAICYERTRRHVEMVQWQARRRGRELTRDALNFWVHALWENEAGATAQLERAFEFQVWE